MKIYIGNDHTGTKIKQAIINYFNHKYQFVNLGVNDEESSNYAEIAINVAKHVISDKGTIGILICGSGEGVCIAANKVHGIRCGLAYNNHVAALIKEHNNANIIAFAAREFSEEEIINMLDIFLKSEFKDERHLKRIAIIDEYEKNK